MHATLTASFVNVGAEQLPALMDRADEIARAAARGEDVAPALVMPEKALAGAERPEMRLSKIFRLTRQEPLFRAIATDPKLILADEPTGDLDAANAESILDLLCRLNQENGQTIVMVTHDPKAADRAHRVMRLEKGALVGEAAP